MFAGKSLTIADQGELVAGAGTPAAAELDAHIQARHDRPLAARVATASLVFRGRVESDRALAPEADKPEPSRGESSEHDPEWHVASVRV